LALTELQLPTKAELYQNLRSIANEMRRAMERWEAASDFINTLQAADLDAMAVPAGAVRTDMVQLRTVLQEITTYFSGSSVTPTNIPKEVVDKIRQMLVI
jgi:hypothetical protein